MSAKVANGTVVDRLPWHRSRPEWVAHERQDLLRQLHDEGCLVCRAMAESERNWRNEYVRESYGDPDVRRRLAASGGFCASHLRALIDDDDGSHVLPMLLGDLIADVLGRPTGVAIRPACEACAKLTWTERGHLDLLLRWLTDSEVFAALAQPGKACLPHLSALVGAAPEPIAGRLTALAKDLIRNLDQHHPLALTGGADPGLPRRTEALRIARQASAEADAGAGEESTLEHVLSGVDRPCCLLCRTRAHAEVRYLSWLSDQLIESLDPGEVALCATHLLDVSVLDADCAIGVAAVVRTIEVTRLDRLAQRLEHTPDKHSWKRLRTALSLQLQHRHAEAMAAMQSRQRFVTGATASYCHAAPGCAACAAGRVAERRELTLLEAAVSHRTVRDHWDRGHGLCVAHAPQLTDELPRTMLRSRLRLLAWELVEAQRKQAWRTRNEPSTAVETSWIRAIPLLCGAAYVGCTPDEIFKGTEISRDADR